MPIDPNRIAPRQIHGIQPAHLGGMKVGGGPTQPVKEDNDPIELEADDGKAPGDGMSKIRALSGAPLVTKAVEYNRKPTLSGQGACRVRTFQGRLSDEALGFMDDKINEWLDRHPEIEVKFVTSTTAVFEGKVREPMLILNIWY